ncbi:MAG: MFS transporter [Polyangiales bacterium]
MKRRRERGHHPEHDDHDQPATVEAHARAGEQRSVSHAAVYSDRRPAGASFARVGERRSRMLCRPALRPVAQVRALRLPSTLHGRAHMSLLRKPSLGVIFLTVAIDLLGFGIVMPFLTLQARDAFGVDAGTAALLGACYSAMQFLFMPLWGRLSDRIGRRPVMLVSIAFSALTMAGLAVALAWSNSIVWLFVCRALSGGATANIGTASAYIADITKPEDRVKGMGMIGMAFGLGFLLGPGLGGLLSTYAINGRHGPVACFVAAGLSVINFVWAVTSLPESLPPARRVPAGEARPISLLRVEAIRGLLATSGVRSASLTNFLIILAFSGLEITYAMYAADAFGLDHRKVGLLFVYMGLVGALVQGGIVRRVSGKIRETSLTLTGLTLMLLGFVGFVLAPRFGLVALFVVSGFIAFGNGLTQPSISAYISRLTDPSRQGEVLSANQSLSSLARVFGPLLGGFLYGQGAVVPFVSCAVANVLALWIARGMQRVQPQVRFVHSTRPEPSAPRGTPAPEPQPADPAQVP